MIVFFEFLGRRQHFLPRWLKSGSCGSCYSFRNHLFCDKQTFTSPSNLLTFSKNVCKPACDEYIRIFEYSNTLVTNIYSDIRLYQFFFYEYIWTFVRVKFVCTNIVTLCCKQQKQQNTLRQYYQNVMSLT